MSNVLSFSKRPYDEDESAVKRALKPTGCASFTTVGQEGELSIHHPERMLVVSFSDQPSAEEINAFWLHIERWKRLRC